MVAGYPSICFTIDTGQGEHLGAEVPASPAEPAWWALDKYRPLQEFRRHRVDADRGPLAAVSDLATTTSAAPPFDPAWGALALMRASIVG